jgi:hypothetical protein
VKGTSVQQKIFGGTQPYSITTFPDTSKATASIASSVLTVLSIDTGNTFLILKDSGTPIADSARIEIHISLTPPPSAVHYAAQIQPIFDAQCISCHGTQGNLSLAAGVSYNNLGHVPAASSCTNLHRVFPGSADNSVLYRKVSGTSCGGRMPQGGSLSAGDIALIRTWINEGANNN